MEIIFLIDSTFSNRDYDRFGIDSFLANNISIQLWDFRKLYQISYKDNGFETDVNLSKKGNLTEAAKKLYKIMREIKKKGFKSMAVCKIPNKGMGEAINERLIKASYKWKK